MRVLVATDAWAPQVNGVVRSLEGIATALASRGVALAFLTPEAFRGFPLPTYPEIRLAWATAGGIARAAEAGGFDAVHIATEGPVGMAARRYCLSRGWTFTTSYHTRFPEYLRARLPLPLSWTYAWLRRFHNAGAATMVSTATLRGELSSRGFRHLVLWSRGVDTALFRPQAARALDLPGPIFLYVGRVAIEKNLDAFLGLDLPGTKVVVGEGPDRARLAARYPQARFLGLKTGQDLAAVYASADVFVFPSRTDTYGIVLLEALASGLPVAALPVSGPMDVIGRHGVGVLDEDLRAAALAALALPKAPCRDFALRHSWGRSADEFLRHLVPKRGRLQEPPALTELPAEIG